MNLQIEKTKQNLINDINEAKLPIGVIELLLKDLMHEVTSLKNQAVQKELAEENKANEEN